jgi:hypothetical protein
LFIKNWEFLEYQIFFKDKNNILSWFYKMSQFKHPICPICKQEILLPFSLSQSPDWTTIKAYGSWICSNCGFYLTATDSKNVDQKHAIEAGFSVYLKKKVEDLRGEYFKKSK